MNILKEFYKKVQEGKVSLKMRILIIVISLLLLYVIGLKIKFINDDLRRFEQCISCEK